MSSRQLRDLVVRADEIEPFALPDGQGVYESQSIIEAEGAGSRDLQVNRFTLKPRQKVHGGSHPVENDECYYILRGHGLLALGGDPQTGEGGETFEIGPDTAIFIPGRTFHELNNPNDEDLVLLTLWPKAPIPGANAIAEERKRLWGTAFRKKGQPIKASAQG